MVAVAACGEPGTQLQVAVDTGQVDVNEVRIYLGKNSSQGVDLGLANVSPDMTEDRVGRAYVIDNAHADDVITVTRGETVTFAYTPPDDSSGISNLNVIAVGFKDGQAVAFGRGLNVWFTKDEIVQMPLTLTAAAPGSNYQSSARQVVVWGPAANPTACVQTVDTSDTPASVFVIRSKIDVDCDGYTKPDDPVAPECSATTYNGQAPADIQDIACSDTVQFPAPACIAGTIPCRDGKPKDPALCLQGGTETFCAAFGVCTQCPSFPCAMPDLADATVCSIPIVVDATGNSRPCYPTVQIAQLAPMSPSLHCANDDSAMLYDAQTQPPSWTNIYEQQNLHVEVHRKMDCSVELELSAIDPTISVYPQSIRTLVAVRIGNDLYPQTIGAIVGLNLNYGVMVGDACPTTPVTCTPGTNVLNPIYTCLTGETNL
ncbi:MAG TPA: hypothetical protein VGM90_10900 [Kofleriaceae bacterium]